MKSVQAEEVHFRRDVLPLLTKLGCNSGPCHGNLTGKGGFKLSLRGEDPKFDWYALTHDQSARRISLTDPASSLVLGKPAGLMPHEGGIRFRPGDPSYGIIRKWIDQGALDDEGVGPKLVRIKATPDSAWLDESKAHSVQIKVQAEWSDGSLTDVTHLASFDINDPSGAAISAGGRFEVERPGEWVVGIRYLTGHAVSRLVFLEEHSDFEWNGPQARTKLDEAVFGKLKKLRQNPASEASDLVLLRRLYLDLLGILPTVEEIRSYTTDGSSDRYEKLVDRLLERPEFADFWALKWADLLRNEPKVMGSKGNWQFQRWLRDQFAQDRPLDAFARELITTVGSTWTAPASSFHRTNRDPATAAETFTQVFLGYRFQCAKCHNHPSDVWTQNDYYGLAASFANLKRKDINNIRRDRFDKHEVNGDVVVYFDGPAQIVQPRTGELIVAKAPGVSAIAVENEQPGAALNYLADWLTLGNRQFARNLANRVWFQLIGKGVVDPVDDFRESNPPSNPELMDALEASFVQGGMRLKPLARMIVMSSVYRLDSKPAEKYPSKETDFGRAMVRLLPAEVLRDIVDQVTGYTRTGDDGPDGQRATQLAAANTRGEEFMKAFGKPERLLSCECERSDETTLGQAFQMINGSTVRAAVEEPRNMIAGLMAKSVDDQQLENAVTELFLRSLTRKPTSVEMKRLTAYLRDASSKRQAWEDILWATINAKEFMFRH